MTATVGIGKQAVVAIVRETGYREMRAFFSVEHEETLKKCLCSSRNTIPTTALQLDKMVTCVQLLRLLPLLGHIQGGTEQRKCSRWNL
jgi:hypothetical protein